MGWVLLFVAVYLAVALGVTRTMAPRQYAALRTPCNGVQMPEDDARREAFKLSAQTGLLWPVFGVAAGIMLPLWFVFDAIPTAAVFTGKTAVKAASGAYPALAPIAGWVNRPLTLAVEKDKALALAARADEPIEDEPLIPDEIARWNPPVKLTPKFSTNPMDDPVVIEYVDREMQIARARQRNAAKRREQKWREFE